MPSCNHDEEKHSRSEVRPRCRGRKTSGRWCSVGSEMKSEPTLSLQKQPISSYSSLLNPYKIGCKSTEILRCVYDNSGWTVFGARRESAAATALWMIMGF